MVNTFTNCSIVFQCYIQVARQMSIRKTLTIENFVELSRRSVHHKVSRNTDLEIHNLSLYLKIVGGIAISQTKCIQYGGSSLHA